MRITGGTYRGQMLFSPPDDRIRPTSDRVRESLFNILTHRSDIDFEQVYALDLFCGAGTLGLEALSRGAAHVTFVDANKKSLNLTKQNAEKLKVTNQTTFTLSKADHLPQNSKSPCGLIFLDPPYHKNLANSAILSALKKGYVSDRAVFIVEMSSKSIEPVNIPELIVDDERKYGDTIIHIYTYQRSAA
tara:strand:- start:175 stop:741 length:567 start_codon:yes stop_codon:yes gene_type:complete